METINKLLEGKKTYIGVLMTVLGLFLGEADVEFVSDSLDKVLVAVGAVVAAYGRFAAKPKTEE